MRIIGGNFKGRRITAPEGTIARPTTDRVRESVFNILEHGLKPCEDARVLDLFAGSGALGLEALSRGASYVLFVEEHSAARAAIRTNMDAIGLMGRCRIFRRDATKMGPLPGKIAAPFDLVFCDPPYGRGLGELALTDALNNDWIANDAAVVLETGANESPVLPESFQLTDERPYGDSIIRFYSVK